jgi:hypothetical protein
MRTCQAKLRYFNWDGQVHLAKGKTDGQQEDPLEMLIYNLTIHHLWGRVLAKFQLGQIRAHRRDETWSASLWQTFFAASVGAQIPLLAEVPVVAKSWKEMLLVTTSALVPPTRVSRSRGVSDVGTSS